MREAGELNGGATHEIHIFLAPVDPDEETLAKYFTAVEQWNQTQKAAEDAQIKSTLMKACHLSLEYLTEGVGECAPPARRNVRVMQSARFVYDNDPLKVIAAAHRDAAWFESQGLSVVREKIEAAAYGNSHIPQTDAAAVEHPQCYFEFHIKIAGERIDPDELRELANRYSQQYHVPVPFSHNLNPNQFGADAQGMQQYLNMRFRRTGLTAARSAVEALKADVLGTGHLKVPKIISEYVWFDTNVALDRGWID
jgi:hypothetical protein